MSGAVSPWAARMLAPVALAVSVAIAGRAGAQVDPEETQYALARELADRPVDDWAEVAARELGRYERLFPEGRHLEDVQRRLARIDRARGRTHAQAARLLEVVVRSAGSASSTAAAAELADLLARDRGLKRLAPRYREILARPPAENPGGRWHSLVSGLLLIDDDAIADLTVAKVEAWLERHPVGEAATELRFSLADLERRRGQPRQAAAVLLAAAAHAPGTPTVPRALLAAGRALDADGRDPAGARELYQRVAADWPGSPEAGSAWYRLGEVERRHLGRPAIALKDYDEVLRRYPAHPDAFDALEAKAELLAGPLGQPARAEETLRSVGERYPGHPRAPEALERAGRLAERDLGDRRQAATTYAELARRYPGYQGAAQALFRAAELLEQEGQTAAAALHYRETVERFPESRQAGQARKRLARLEP